MYTIVPIEGLGYNVYLERTRGNQANMFEAQTHKDIRSALNELDNPMCVDAEWNNGVWILVVNNWKN